MSERFFVADGISAEETVVVGPEAHHLLHVMRAAVGDRITLFDGSGQEFEAAIEVLSRSSVRCRILAQREISRELPGELTLGVALPKGDRQRWLVEKAVELGVTRLVPLITTRGVTQPTPATTRRFNRIVIEASKQCRRNVLLTIEDAVSFAEFASSNARNLETNQWIADPTGRPLGELSANSDAVVRVAIGPEGGWTEEELATAGHLGWQRVGLGPRILRVETAVAAVAAYRALSHAGAESHEDS